jgi:hypothetical protein
VGPQFDPNVTPTFPLSSTLFLASISGSTSALLCYQIISSGAACLLHPAKHGLSFCSSYIFVVNIMDEIHVISFVWRY